MSRLKLTEQESASMIDGYTSPVGDTDYYSIGGYRLNAEEEQKRDGWKARSDIPSWPLADPIDWYADPFEDPNWYSQFHGWRPMDPHLQAYRRTGDASHLRHIVPWAVHDGRSVHRATSIDRECDEVPELHPATLVARRSRVLNVPWREVGEGTLSLFQRDCRRAGLTLFSADRFNFVGAAREGVRRPAHRDLSGLDEAAAAILA